MSNRSRKHLYSLKLPTNTMNKKECLQLWSAANSCYAMGSLSIYLIYTVENKDIPSNFTLKNLQKPNKKYTFNIPMLREAFRNETIKIKLISEFNKAILRTSIHRIFEIVKEYAVKTNQEHKLYDSELMVFTRLLRNNVAHNLKFNFRNKKDIERLKNKSVKWRDKEITLEMEGKQIPFDLMDFTSVSNLFLDIREFIKTELD